MFYVERYLVMALCLFAFLYGAATGSKRTGAGWLLVSLLGGALWPIVALICFGLSARNAWRHLKGDAA